MPGTELLISPPAQSLRPATAGEEVERLAAAAVAYADASKASSTRRAYDSSWRAFSAWCADRGLRDLPAATGTVAGYLADLAPRRSVATLGRHLAALRDKHLHDGAPFPDSAELLDVWIGIRRTHGRAPRRVRALVTADLRKVIGKLPASPSGVRDKAMLLIAFAGALRRSELVALELGQYAAVRCSFVAGGLQITIGRSKTDQLGEGQAVAIPRGRTKLCPVAALRAWLDLSGILKGPIFRGVDRHGRVAQTGLSDRAFADIVKRAVLCAGFDPLQFSGHSLRAGFVTQAAANDVGLDVIMRQTRHTKTDTVMRYVREADMFKHNAAGKVGL
jgi:integrase